MKPANDKKDKYLTGGVDCLNFRLSQGRDFESSNFPANLLAKPLKVS